MYVGTYETSSLSLFSYQKCVYISLCLSSQFAFCFDDFIWVDPRQNLEKKKERKKKTKIKSWSCGESKESVLIRYVPEGKKSGLMISAQVNGNTVLKSQGVLSRQSWSRVTQLIS